MSVFTALDDLKRFARGPYFRICRDLIHIFPIFTEAFTDYVLIFVLFPENYLDALSHYCLKKYLEISEARPVGQSLVKNTEQN